MFCDVSQKTTAALGASAARQRRERLARRLQVLCIAAIQPKESSMIVFVPAAFAVLVRLSCTRCGDVQARARGVWATSTRCRRCGHELSARDVQPSPWRASSSA